MPCCPRQWSGICFPVSNATGTYGWRRALEPQWGSAGAGAIAEHYRLANRPEEELRWRVLAAEHA